VPAASQPRSKSLESAGPQDLGRAVLKFGNDPARERLAQKSGRQPTLTFSFPGALD